MGSDSDKPKYQFALTTLFGLMLVAGLCSATVRLLRFDAIFFIPIYVVVFVDWCERPTKLIVAAASALIVVLSVLSAA